MSGDTARSSEQGTQASTMSFGMRLRQAREAVGWSPSDVAQRLYLTEKVVEALEAEDYDAGPGPTFMRGYLRGYARLMEIPESALPVWLDGGAAPPRQTIRQTAGSGQSQARSSDRPVRWITYLVVIVILGLTAVWWQTRVSEDYSRKEVGELESESEPATPGLAAPPVAPVAAISTPGSTAADPVSPPYSDESDSKSGVSASPLQSPEDSGYPPQRPAEAPASAPDRPAEEPVQEEMVRAEMLATDSAAAVILEPAPELRLVFADDCWVRIDGADGARLRSGTVAAGETLDFSGSAPYKLILGRASAVTVEHHGEPFDLTPYTKGDVARFEITATRR